MIFINFKTYELGTGSKALEFVTEAQKIQEETQVELTILAQATDIRMLAMATSLPIWSQHVDEVEYGPNTGWILPNAVIEAGAKGTMINHGEHKLPLADVSEIINKYQSPTFNVLLSTTSPEETIVMDQLRPAFLAYEPQEYIGTKTSVVEAAPDIIRSLVSRISCPLIIGAGIHTADHITNGLNLGAKGFLISSDVLLSQDPYGRLREYMLAYRDASNTLR